MSYKKYVFYSTLTLYQSHDGSHEEKHFSLLHAKYQMKMKIYFKIKI